MKVNLVLWLVVLLAACQVTAKVRALYDILQVSPSASTDEIKKAYKRLVKKNHPDKGGSHAQFVAISRAYQTLSKPERRMQYDLEGERTLKPFTTQDARDVYRMFWSENAHGLFKTSKASEHNLNVTLAQIYTGGDIQVTLRQHEHCPHCGGSEVEESEVCPDCMGRGLVLVPHQVFPGVISGRLRLCDCGGTGTIIHQACPICNGDKTLTKMSPLIIPLPRGALEGHKILVRHKDRTVGDLVFRLVEQEEPGWCRKGEDLFLIQTINSREASFGFSSTILHVNGTNFTISREGETISGFTETLRGMGMPYPPSFMDNFRQYGFGDLHITYQVA